MLQNRAREASGAFLLLLHALVSVGLDVIPPATFLIAFAQTCVYLRLFSLPWSDLDDVCIGVIGVLVKGEWQRIFYGAIEHGDSLHLYYNMVSFIWKGINLEEKVGTVQFVWIIFFLTALTGVLIVGLYYLLGIYVDAIFYRHCGIGFSGVIFALKVLNNVKYPGQSLNIFGVHVTLPSGFLVWFEPLLVQLITGNGSFVGHFAGALAGLIYLGMLKPIFDDMWLLLVEAPRSAVRYLCPCLLPVPYGAILLSAALLATNADFLSTSELKLEAAETSSWTSSLINDGQWHLLLAPVLRCSGRLHLAYTVDTLLGVGYRLERKVGTARFLVDTAILAIVTNVACGLTTHYVLPNYAQITDVSTAQMSHKCFAGPTAILLALKALYGGGRWLRKYPMLFLTVPMPRLVGAMLEIGLIQFVLPDLSTVGHTVGFLAGLMMSYVLPQP
ncbi:hypothetical protein HPB52_010786 [Rhipicephalus sanguineus]|uniref:Peptidase S54 rhomboid domain-containing protein n=1 Tax=Rhipicephalus sanguineus TaxID=34632 RepID=A0A9D4PSK0_RHISA|nr:hypothetical protein HPB52_010786 [Rhipicephalus sanguineus]